MTAQLFAVDGVEPVPSHIAASVVVQRHYLHRRPPISYAYGWWSRGQLLGVCTFGVPASRHVQMSVCPSDPDLAVELNRLWVDDAEPRNTESRFVAACLRLLPPLLVFSYADTAAGHVGYIYRALNFHYAGVTDQDRKTPRGDRVASIGGRHARDASRNGRSGPIVRRLPKHRYWIATGNRRDRKRLTAACGWPSVRWDA